jgi:putative membrane protein
MNGTDLLLSAQQPMYNGGGGRGSWGMNMMYSPFGGWFMILLLIVVVAAAFMIFRGGSGSGPAGHAQTPLDILKRRYAAGEITKEQYEEMKRDLSE